MKSRFPGRAFSANSEATVVEATLRSIIGLTGQPQIILSDGRSRDETVSIAARFRATVVTGTRGRGKQMMAGACEATGDVLWFLHSNNLAPPDAAEQSETALRPEEVVVGHFRIHIRGEYTCRPNPLRDAEALLQPPH